jgi:catalase (peroxidase I)
MDGSNLGWQEVVISAVAIAFLFGGVVVVLVGGMRVAQTKIQAEASTEHTMMVRTLAEESTVAQRNMASEITEVRLAMVDIRDRLAAIERMMADVG